MIDDLSIKNPTSPDNGNDFIPVPKIVGASDEISPSSQTERGRVSLAERLKQARLSMQGPERTVERERSDREKQIAKEKNELEQLLALTVKKKEDLEIAWVVLDNKRNDLKKMLAPILEEEEKLEFDEEELEGRERTTSIPAERQKIEKGRLAVQAKRQTIEKEKWGFEDKILKIETSIKDNTDKYQVYLDEEEEVATKIESLDGELALISEQERLEKEERQRKLELTQADSEKKRRGEIEKLQQAEAEKKKTADLVQKAEEAKKKELVDKIKRDEEAKLKAQHDEAGAAAGREVEQAKAAAAAQRSIDDAKRRAQELATMKARGDMEMKRQAASTENLPFDKGPITLDPHTLTAPLEPKAEPEIPVSKETMESPDLPKLRTLKTDLAKIKGEGKSSIFNL